MRTVTYNLKALLRAAEAGAFTIPVFQRDFVWKETQVRLLVDSVSRGFPIGSLLVLAERTTEIRLASRPIQAAIRAMGGEDAGELASEPMSGEGRVERSYVLDGQQRLTSLVRVFRDASASNAYYVDLKRLVEQFVPNGGTTWKRASASEQQWLRSLTRKDPNPDRRVRNRYLRADIVLDSETCQVYVQEYLEDSPDFEGRFTRTQRRQAAAAINGVFETIRNYQVPVVVIDPDSPLEAICRIFETINSTGTRLTTFDLAVARFYPGLDLHSRRDEVFEISSALKEFKVDGERILQVICLWSARERGVRPDVTRSAILELNREFIEKKWDDAASSLDDVYGWAKEHGASERAAPNEAMMVAMAAFFGLVDKRWRQSRPFDPVLERWYFSKLLQANAWGASNYKIGEDFRVLMAWLDADQQPTPERVYLTADVLIDLVRSDVRYSTLQALLSMRAGHDIKTGQALSRSTAEDHHIFPRSLAQKLGLSRRRIDSICNRMYVSAETNRMLADRLPEDYMREIALDARQARVEARVDQRLRDAAIPGSVTDPGFATQFALNRFESFLHLRARAILEQVRDVIGDALDVDGLQTQSSEADDEIEDDE